MHVIYGPAPGAGPPTRWSASFHISHSDRLKLVAMSRLTPSLTESSLARACRALARIDPDLAQIHAEFGTPPLWGRPPGFPTLIHIILEQQVSLASARAAMDRLLAAASPLTPKRLLEFDDAEMKAIGFSRQKMGYARLLALTILDGFDIATLEGMNDDEVRATLMALKGIGRWSADIYLLMALRRPDVWPRGDLALIVAAQQVKRLPARPSSEEFESLGNAWRPHRSAAARLLWWHYLAGKD
jgi:DNA-3-methyladenine glycosylase II